MEQQKPVLLPTDLVTESAVFDTLNVMLQTTPLATIAIDLDGTVMLWNPAARRMFGWTEEEVRGQSLPILAGDEQDAFYRHLHMLMQGGSFESYETRMVRKDSSLIDTGVVVSPLRDAGGRIGGVICQITDNTKRIRTAQRRVTHYRVSEILEKKPDLDEAAPLLLSAICAGLEWGIGFLWIFDPEKRCLVCAASHALPTYANARLITISERHQVQPGVSLVGQVWKTGKPAWIGGTNTRQPRLRYAAEVGLYGNYLFPVVFGNQVAGVFEFFSRKSRQPDPDLLRLLQAIGSQVGQFVALLQAEQHARRTQQAGMETLVETLQLGIARCDRHGRILEANEIFTALLGYSQDDFRQAELTWNDLLAPEDQTTGRHFMVRAFSEEGSQPEIYTLLRAGGCPVRVLLAGSVLSGEPRSVIACCLALGRGDMNEGYRNSVMQLLSYISQNSTGFFSSGKLK